MHSRQIHTRKVYPGWGGSQRMDGPGQKVATVTISDEGRWIVATDQETGVASQGETKPEALENLAEAIELHTRKNPERIDDADAVGRRPGRS